MNSIVLVAVWLLHVVAAAPGKVYAQCEPVTSYIPVTQTVTVTVPPSSELATSNSLLLRTSTSAATSTVHPSQSPDQISAASTGQNQVTYSFIVESGHTSWYGVTPSSGLSLTTITTTIFVFPSRTVSILPVTTVATVTIEPPPYVSTSYSLANPTTTSTVYKTKTSTTVITNTVTRVRTAFSSLGSSGWNTTIGSTGETASDAIVSSVDGIPTTITGTIYWSIGTKITSTSLTTLTLTLTRSRTSTLTLTPTSSILTINRFSSLDEPALSGTTSSTSLASQVPTSALLRSSIAGESSAPISRTLISSLASTDPINMVPASYAGTVDPTSLSSQGSSTRLISSSLSSAATESLSSRSFSFMLSRTTSIVSTSQTLSSTSVSVGFATSNRAGSASSISQWSSTVETSQETSSRTVSSSTLVSLPIQSSRASRSLSTSTGSASTGSSSLQPNSITSAAGISRQPIFSSSHSQQTISLQEPAVFSTSSPTQSTHSASSVQGGGSSFSTSSHRSSTLPHTSLTAASNSSSQLRSTSNSLTAITSSTTADPQASESVPTTLTRSVTLSNTAISSSSITPTPSVCGEHGNFTLNFDDLPSFMPNQTIDITQAPPVFNGYHHMAFSNGYVYAPPPDAPFPPISQPHLAVFLGNASGNGTNNTPTAMAPVSGMIRPGEFGNGVSDSVSAFWFNGYTAWLGCDNSGPEPCTYVVTAYAWNAESLKEEQIDSQTLTTPACPGFNDCHLQQVTFPSTFHGLSGLQIQAYKGPDQVMFFMDDVQLGWYNNTCAAGLQRLRSPRSGPLMRRLARLPKH